MPVIPLKDIETAAEIVYRHMRPTPEISWPLLNERAGAEVIVKHENHTPIGAFKVRGGLNYMTRLKEAEPDCPGVITATRGNHGQSVSRAATAVGLRSVIYVPQGNNPEKNAAMRAFGAELMVHGEDFQESREEAARVGEAEGLHMIPPFHPNLVAGVGTYALELLQAHPDLDTVYVPVGMGSGICGLISARDGLGLKTRIVGIVADRAPAYALSFERPANPSTPTTPIPSPTVSPAAVPTRRRSRSSTPAPSGSCDWVRTSSAPPCGPIFSIRTTSPRARGPGRWRACCRRRTKWPAGRLA